MLRTFTLMTLSACMAASAFAAGTNNDIRPHKKDTRVFVTLVNKSVTFRDVKIDGRTYTLQPHDLLTVKGPTGTVVYADCKFGKHQRGDALVSLDPSMDHSRISID